MLQLFKNIDLSVILIAFFYFFVFYTANFICDLPPLSALSAHSTFITQSLYSFVDNIKFLQHLFIIVSILWQSFALNSVVNEYKLTKKATFITLPAAYVIAFLFIDNDHLSSFLLANNFLVPSLWFLFRCYDKKSGLSEVFNCFFLLALSSLFSISFIVYVPLFLLGLLMLRGTQWRELLAACSGFFAPFFLCFTYFFINSSASIWLSNLFQNIGLASFNINFNVINSIAIINLVLISLFSIFNFSTLLQKTTIREQKYVQIIFLMLLFSLLTIFTQSQFNSHSFTILFIPLSILLSINLQSIKSNNTKELLYLYLFLIAIASQYGNLFFK